jgi:hypothetical protein
MNQPYDRRQDEISLEVERVAIQSNGGPLHENVLHHTLINTEGRKCFHPSGLAPVLAWPTVVEAEGGGVSFALIVNSKSRRKMDIDTLTFLLRWSANVTTPRKHSATTITASGIVISSPNVG